MKEQRGLLLIIMIVISCILMWGFCFIECATDASDASVLNVMYTSLNLPAQLTGWTSTGGDPCGQSWKGVTCSGSRVTSIKINGLGLSGSLGYQLASLTAVSQFDVSNNNIGGTIPYQLPPNVLQLNLASCNFNGAIPYSISQMTSLKYLDLSHNQLNGQLNDMFQQLSSLSTMDLSNNAFTGNLPQSFNSLTSLNTLNLQNNQFTGTIDVSANLPLNNLNVANNHFMGWIPHQLENINLRKDGNSWNSGPAPPAPPGTSPAKYRRHNKSGNHNTSSAHSSSGNKKSGISAGAIAGIVMSILVVGTIVAFFLVKRRSRRSAPDVEKVYKQPFTALSKDEVHELKSIHSSSSINSKTLETASSITLKPPPSDRHKSFDEDDTSSKPVGPAVTKKPILIPTNVKSYSIADLQMATDSFSADNLIGEGYLGRVYRAQFYDGEVYFLKLTHAY